MNEQQRLLKQLYALKADLEKLGCKVEITVQPPVARKAYRVTEAQRAILLHIKHHGSYRYPDPTPTLKALLKKGLVTATFRWPMPGNDYGSTYEYRLTEAGKVVMS